ncbi:hypothetical protein GQ43DRAFT_464650 [Delitschia confertaspora ATCC 74209]|uniref:Uncharacterized protein n=1 Tax=Delitschia confertaspora ATCC 74209 TaxID=1513339 RepID=A0A9P4JK63_9PLEO|nr:hypothetical protein GQ43DRAFT_464650 [Delitschia confertaspora ATCC 74209]
MDVEIFVHISARTTRKQDGIYQSLADAYSEFEPYNPNTPKEPNLHSDSEVRNLAINDFRSSFGIGPPPGAEVGDITAGVSRTGIGVSTHDVVIPPGSDDTYGSFPSQTSFAGGYNDGDRQSIPPSSDEEGYCERPSHRVEQIERIYSQWKRFAPNSSTLRATFATASLPMFVEDTQQAAQNVESQIYESFSIYQSDSQAFVPDEGQNQQTHINSEAPFDTREENLSMRVEEHIEKTSISAVSQTHSHNGDDNAHESEAGGDDEDNFEFDFSALPTEILPPPPSVSLETHEKLPSQLTKELEAMKEQNRGRFTPEVHLRKLEPDERGCWMVHTAKWSRKAQGEFWSSLSEHVCRGTFGWGVTLHRDDELDEETPGRFRPLGYVRLYCWGEMVEHVWLYLWLCSNGQIIGGHSCWVDADQELVIRMP